MEKPSTTNPTTHSSPKIPTMEQLHTYTQQQKLPKQYLKLILFFGLTKNIIKSLESTINQNQNIPNQQKQNLKKMYCKQLVHNCFSSIQPIKKNITNHHSTYQLFHQLKKLTFSLLKHIKISQKIKSTQKHKNHIHQFHYTSSKNLLSIKNMPLDNIDTILNNSPSPQLNTKRSYQKQFGQTAPNCHYHHHQHQSNPSKLHAKLTQTQPNNWFTNTTHFKTKLTNQRSLFKKFNCFLSKYYTTPPTSRTLKGSLQIFSIFIASLFEVKTIINTYLMDIVSVEINHAKKRFIYQINQMNNINDKILDFYKNVAESNRNSIRKIKQLQKIYMEAITQLANQHSSTSLIITSFIKKLTFMIESTKIIINTPSIDTILHSKIKILPEMFENLSYFRFFAKYLTVEILTTNKNITKSKQNTQVFQLYDDYQNKWKKMFDKKYKPIRINTRTL